MRAFILCICCECYVVTLENQLDKNPSGHKAPTEEVCSTARLLRVSERPWERARKDGTLFLVPIVQFGAAMQNPRLLDRNEIWELLVQAGSKS